jgi:hypothetical protein
MGFAPSMFGQHMGSAAMSAGFRPTLSLIDLLKSNPAAFAAPFVGRTAQALGADDKVSGGLGGAAQGATLGASIGGPWGAAIGGVLGGLGGILSAPDEPTMREQLRPMPTRNIMPALQQMGDQYRGRYRLPQSGLSRYLAMMR